MSEQETLARLKAAAWLADAKPFFDCLGGDDGATRAVGGIVRDTLLGRAQTTTDIDLATVLRPQEVMERAQAADIRAHPTGLEHGTVTLVAGGVTAEVTTLREDVETFGRHAKVRFGTDWAKDARRRDFTMNALYADAAGALFDPLGGLGDCLARKVKFIGNADNRIAEDRLRVYRYFRFAASHGAQQFDAEALAACARVADDLDQLSAERVGSEMVRLLGLAKIGETLGEMKTCGVLDDIVMSQQTLERLVRYESLGFSPELSGRLALILAGGIEAEKLQDKWRLSNAQINAARSVFQACGDVLFGQVAEVAYRLPEHKFTIVAVASVLGEKDERWLAEHMAQMEQLVPDGFPVSGKDLVRLGYHPGPELGAELKRLEKCWLEAGYGYDKAALLAMARPPEN